MRTNIDIDDKNIASLMAFGKFKTKKEAINAAIETQINILNRKKMVEMFGKFEWEGDLEEWRKSRFPEWDGSTL
ncbi:MAG: type II toxin-antitoxin system VapB family antitoxin [Bacteroidota bacterium]|nr:type II toxin-antitoxin system VapB family antitoxin [Bacteroidota bacterium]